VDDRYVITHDGDELRLQFDASGLPETPGHGRKRSFFAVATLKLVLFTLGY
jgi:hypothetical protein